MRNWAVGPLNGNVLSPPVVSWWCSACGEEHVHCFAIVDQPLNDVCFAVEVRPMDGKIGSNRALAIGVTLSSLLI